MKEKREKDLQQKQKNPIPGLIITPEVKKKTPKPEAPKSEAKSDKKPKKAQPDTTAQVEELSQQLSESAVLDPNLIGIELSKKLKRLRRRVRDTEILEEKIESGELVPEKDQVEKLSRKSELLYEIKELEEQRKQMKEK